MKALVVRCETGAALGAGHVMRGLALAQEWKARGGRAIFALGSAPPPLERRLHEEGCEVVEIGWAAGSAADASATAALACESGAGWVALDGPMFGAGWEAAFPADVNLLRIDDESLRGSFRAEALLNQNLGADASDYPRPPADCRLLLGTKFALLRREFRAARGATALRSPRALVTLGGTDPAHATERILDALLQPALRDVEIDLIVGAANPRRDAILDRARSHSPRWRAHINPPNLPEMMAGATFALTAGGTTLYELSYFGTPMLVLATAENQRRTAERFGAAGAAHFAGWHADLEPAALAAQIDAFRRDVPRRTVLGETAARLVDGRGPARVVDALLAWRRAPQDVCA